MPNSSFIHIIGHAGKDPMIRPVGESSKVCNFSVAYTRKRKDKEITTWFDVSAWSKLGEFVASHLKKGDPVAVSGELYQDTFGEGKTVLRIEAANVTLLKGRDAERPKDATPTAAAEAKNFAPGAAANDPPFDVHEKWGV